MGSGAYLVVKILKDRMTGTEPCHRKMSRSTRIGVVPPHPDHILGNFHHHLSQNPNHFYASIIDNHAGVGIVVNEIKFVEFIHLALIFNPRSWTK